MADPYNFSFDVAAFLEEQEAADTSVASKEGVMKKPEAPVEAPMPITEKLKKRLADTVQGFYNSTQDIRDNYNKTQEINPLFGRDAAQNEWMKALEAPSVTTTELSPEMDTIARQDAQEQAAIRSVSGITESLGRPAPTGLMSPDIEEVPVVDTSIDEAVSEAIGESETSSDFENILTNRLISEEKFRAKPYRATKGEEFLTIGYGHYGSDVKEGQELTKEEALTLLKKDINERLPAIRKAIPAFDSLSDELKVEISQSWFRGGMSGSPATIKLINKGKFKEASKEFLNNKEYMTARERGRAGIIPRMEAVAAALEEEEAN